MPHMNGGDRQGSLPLPTIRRYPAYLRLIRERMAAGEEEISSAALAAALGIDPVLARKDIAMMGIPGRPRWGYPARELVEAMQRALGWDNATDAALVGCGSKGGYASTEKKVISAAEDCLGAEEANKKMKKNTQYSKCFKILKRPRIKE